MRAAVVHHTLNTLGGETAVAIDTIESLHELGYDVDLFTVQPPDQARIARAYGKTVPLHDIVSLVPFRMNFLGIYQKPMTALLSSKLRGADVIVNTHGDLLPAMTHVPTITYVHFPSFLLTGSEEFKNAKYANSVFWRAYFRPYQSISLALAKRAARNPGLVVANSLFTKQAMKRALPDLNVQLLYPPVDTDRFSKASESDHTGGSVLVISRFSPEKQLENAIQIALRLPKVRFEIMGALMQANQPYFRSIQALVEKSGLSGRLTLRPNATNGEMIDAMSRSSAYLHTMAGEHFGMSIVEAMSAGLIPIVPSYGGCSEIVPAEYQYSTIEEAADRISQALATATSRIRRRMRDMAMRFSSAEFRNGMKSYVEQIVSGEAVSRPWPPEAA